MNNDHAITAKFNTASVGGPHVEIMLVPAPSNNRYVISALPSFPIVQAKARVVGLTPDPTASTTFRWSVSLKVHENFPAKNVDFGHPESGESEVVQNITTTGEGLYTLRFKHAATILGGLLQLTATATNNGIPLPGVAPGVTPRGLRIDGTNPQRSAIQEYIDQHSDMVPKLSDVDVRDTLKRMACRESGGQLQFRAPANGGIGPELVAPDDGVGILQITNSPCDPFLACPGVIFNWQRNIDKAIAALQEKSDFARPYPGILRNEERYINFIQFTVNPQRAKAHLKLISGAPAPDFTVEGSIDSSNPPNQLLRDTVRGYNGFGPKGSDGYGHSLHEFKPNTDFLMQVQEVDGLDSNWRVWQEVPASQFHYGDSDYLTHVVKQDPECGGDN
jgi:hypothetical protein